MTKLGKDLIESANEALAIARGEASPARAFIPDRVDVAGIRRRLGLSQDKFARRFSLSAATIRDWEQGPLARHPSAGAPCGDRLCA